MTGSALWLDNILTKEKVQSFYTTVLVAQGETWSLEQVAAFLWVIQIIHADFDYFWMKFTMSFQQGNKQSQLA